MGESISVSVRKFYLQAKVAPEDLGPIFLQKGPREQYKGIHDIVNGQGFAMHYRAISNTVSHLEVFRCERINTAKQKDGLTSFYVQCFRSKDLSIRFSRRT